MFRSEIQNESPVLTEGKQAHVLLIDDELSICTGIQGILELDGYTSAYTLTYKEGLEYIDTHPDVDIVLLDVNLRSDKSGIEIIPLIKEHNKYVQVVMFTSYDRLDVGLECMKQGALDFMTKPFDEKQFSRIVPIALEKKRLEQIKDLYFDMVVHDLKNPLQCICGSFEVLREQLKDSLSPMQKKMFETAESGINQIQLIIGNILGITSFEKGSLTARRESFQIIETVKETAKIYDSVELYFSELLPLAIRSDRDLYMRILTNLLSNAARFAAIGTTIKVYCEYDVTKRFLTTSVMNKGSFIREEHREAIFNKFIGVQKSIGSLKGQNFGLGLTFSKMAVEALEGKIWVESHEESKETVFRFRIKDFTVS